MIRLTIARSAFEEVLRRHLLQLTEAGVFTAGRAQSGKFINWVAGRGKWLLLGPSAWPADGDFVVVAPATNPGRVLQRLCTEVGRRSSAWRVLLVPGISSAQGEISGAVVEPTSEVFRLDELALVGPGMHRFLVAPPIDLLAARYATPSESEGNPYLYDPFIRWSRTIGALGEEAWKRFTGLHYGVIGCGRSGSLFASALARLGVRRLTLVDPDVVEMSTFGENADGLRPSDVSRSKAAALADALQRANPHVTVDSVVASVSTLHALIALRPCDVLITCVDSDEARLAVAILAALYARVHLDVGTGVHRGTGNISGSEQEFEGGPI